MRYTRLSSVRPPVRIAIAFAILFVCGYADDLPAQSSGDDEQHRFNYCFASHLGSGVYDISGRIIQIYRLPLFHDFRELEGNRYGLTLKTPVTFGFYDFKSTDVEDSDLPENLGTITVVPALEIPVRILTNWYLAPSAGFGFGKDLAGGDLAYIYQVVLRSVASFPRRRFDYTFWNVLAYLGHTVRGDAPNEDLAVFETGLDVRRPLKRKLRGHELDIGFFVANYIFTEPTEYFLADDLAFEVGAQYEIGFTVGTSKEIKVWRVPVPRLGLSYRFGDGLSVVRFVFGNPF